MSSSKSSQSSAQTYTDNRTVMAEGSLYANNGASVSTSSTNYVLDGGAIEASMDLGKSALKMGSTTIDQALTFGAKVLDSGAKQTDRALDNLQQTQQLVATAYEDAKGRGALTDKILIGSIAAMAIVAGMALRKGHA